MDINLRLTIVILVFNKRRIRTNKLVDEIGQDIYSILVFGFLLVDFIEEFLVFGLDLLQLILGLLLFHLIVHNSLLEELSQITLAEVILLFLSGGIVFDLAL